MFTPFRRVAASGRCSCGLWLNDAPYCRSAFDPITMSFVERFSFDTVKLQVDVDCHTSSKVISSVPKSPTLNYWSLEIDAIAACQ